MTAVSKDGAIRIPRWVTDPDRSAGEFGEYVVAVPAGLVAAVNRLASEFAVSDSAVLLAAHAAVLRRLTGEPTVSCGLLVGDEVRSGRLPVPDGPWSELIRGAHDAGFTDGSPVETVVGLVADRLPDGTVLSVALDRGSARLRLTYRGDVADDAYAARLAGYHLAALRAMVADAAAPQETESLLSAEELTYQQRELAGPHRDLPDLRAHQVFEQRVLAHPDAVAASCAGRQLTYRALNDNANRVAHALLGGGLRPEDVVAVVTDRNLDWLACVLGVFKAGGAYLPVEPHFPAERVAAMVRRSDCRFALVEPAHSAVLGSVADAGLTVLSVQDCVSAGPTHDVEVSVAPDQLAYIYFTSGSTGEPKGAMCEHAGLLNHLYAKIDDLGIEAGTVVAQTAPQCFDISLWQLISALLVGGRTVVIGQDSVLDVNRFVEEVVLGQVEVLQVVPSYLDVVLARFDGRDDDLGRLRIVSTTGEALKAELVRRWFARFPGIRVVNAYGLTETSDDTNHEVLDGPPATDRISLGPPVNNVLLAVVDEWLRPVPLGAPGEIIASGVCVGRGYINDEQRTALSFLPDPARQGGRRYRTGDFGRWSPDGKLEYLGRRDAQVKIRGFRVEIDEVENRLLRVDGVRDAAVVVVGQGNASRLVAFYRAVDIPAETVRGTLAEWLPEYMVPSQLHVLDELPLTSNGKTDKKTLVRLAGELADDASPRALPRTETEGRLVRAWSKALGIAREQIGRHDNFFDLGGTSLAAVKLMIGLDRVVSLPDLAAHPVLAELADLIDRRTARLAG